MGTEETHGTLSMPWDTSYGIKSLNSAVIRLRSIADCCGYEDDVSYSSKYGIPPTYTVENVHDDNLYLKSL